jgi:membrane-associated phospholipid phosphatase
MIRNVADRRRPYEVYETLPAMNKDSKGKSFPSRHLTSISVIAMSLLGVSIPIGIVFLVFTLVMAALRVILGVHFIKDVAVGAAIGIVFGIIGIFIVPIFI